MCSSIPPQDPPICHEETLAGLIHNLRHGSWFYTWDLCKISQRDVTCCQLNFKPCNNDCTPFMMKETYCTVNEELCIQRTKSFVCVFSMKQVSFTVSCLIFPASGFCPAWQRRGKASKHSSLNMRGYTCIINICHWPHIMLLLKSQRGSRQAGSQ